MSISITERIHSRESRPLLEKLEKLRRPIPGIKGLLQKDIDAPYSEPSFNALEDLAVTIRHTGDLASDDTRDMKLKLDDTADQLLEEIAAHEEQTHKPEASLAHIWSAAKAWDATKTEATEGLLAHLLENSGGLSGQVALNKAFLNAKRNGSSFEKELDLYNERQRASLS